MRLQSLFIVELAADPVDPLLQSEPVARLH